MSAYTNGVGTGPSLSLSDMVGAMERALASAPKLPQSYPMHPDDYAELKRTASLKDGHRPIEWMPLGGVEIVLDPAAPRLPRKPAR